MKWNLRLAAANRGIWKASELQRLLAERGMVISAGKMSGLWSGQPNTVRLDELDVICAVLGCEVEELLLPEPETVPQPAAGQGEQAPAVRGPRRHAPAARGQVPAAPVNCLHCGAPHPAGSRRDRSTAAITAVRWPRTTGARTEPRRRRAGSIRRCGAATTPLLRGRRPAARQLGRGPRLVYRPPSAGALDGLMAVLDGRAAGERVTLTEIRQRMRTPRHSSARGSPKSSPIWACWTTTALPRSAPGSTAAPANCPAGSPARSAPGCWCCSTATPGPGPGRTPASTSTSAAVQPLHRALGSRHAATSARSPPATSDASLDPLRGHQLRTATVAVRSLFRFAKKRGLVFANPASAADGRRPRRQPAADDRRRDPGRRAGRRQPRAAADRRPGRGPRRPLGRDPRPHPGRPRPAQPAHHHRRAPPAARRVHLPGAAGLAWTPPRHLAATPPTGTS